MRRRGTVHPWKHHAEIGIVVGLGPSLFPAVDIFLYDEILLIFVGCDVILCSVFPLEALDTAAHWASLLGHTVALHPRRLAVEIGLVKHRWRVPKLSCRQGTVPILLPAEVAEQSEQVLRIVFIHRWVGRGPNHDGRKRAVPKKHHGHAQRQRVDSPPSSLVRNPQQGCDRTDEQGEVHQCARVEWHPQVVDKEQFKTSRQLNRPLDQCLLHEAQKHNGEHPRQNKAFPREFMVAVEIHQRNGWNGQQIEQVHTNGQPHQVGNQNDPLGRPGLVRHVLPFQNRPKHEGSEQARQGVHLSLHRAEPKRIAKGVGECANRTCAQHRHR